MTAMFKKTLGIAATVALATGAPVTVGSGDTAVIEANVCAAGTCWKGHNADCIIDGQKTENACDASTPGCFPNEE